MSRALVVFRDSDAWWLRWLRRDYRHVFVVLPTSTGAIVVDPLAHVLGVEHVDGLSLSAARAFYGAHGCSCVEVALRAPRPRPAFGPLTCVEVVKRVIGLQAPWVMTPWQLWRRLHV